TRLSRDYSSVESTSHLKPQSLLKTENRTKKNRPNRNRPVKRQGLRRAMAPEKKGANLRTHSGDAGCPISSVTTLERHSARKFKICSNSTQTSVRPPLPVHRARLADISPSVPAPARDTPASNTEAPASAPGRYPA